VFRFFEVDL